jgi:hypothetical protein
MPFEGLNHSLGSGLSNVFLRSVIFKLRAVVTNLWWTKVPQFYRRRPMILSAVLVIGR